MNLRASRPRKGSIFVASFVLLLGISVVLIALGSEIALDLRMSSNLAEADQAREIARIGIDYAIHRILTRHGLADLPVAANHLEPDAAERRWRLASPFESASCRSGTCKCELVQTARDRDDVPVLLIGDGRSDFCASQSVDFVFAKSKLIEHCRTTGAAHSPVTGFAMVLGLLPQLDRFVTA